LLCGRWFRPGGGRGWGGGAGGGSPGSITGAPGFAARVANEPDGRALVDLRALAAEGTLADEVYGQLAQARSMLFWHQRHGFCAVCGSPTTVALGGYRRDCAACDAQHFPRVAALVEWKQTEGINKQRVVWPAPVQEILLKRSERMFHLRIDSTHEHLAVTTRALGTDEPTQDETLKHSDALSQLPRSNFPVRPATEQAQQQRMGGRAFQHVQACHRG